jgi:hypothetical protein
MSDLFDSYEQEYQTLIDGIKSKLGSELQSLHGGNPQLWHHLRHQHTGLGIVADLNIRCWRFGATQSSASTCCGLSSEKLMKRGRLYVQLTPSEICYHFLAPVECASETFVVCVSLLVGPPGL